LNYACYQDARFLLVATPSGITLAPEGGAHQSVSAPLIGIGQPGLVAYEPAFQDELAEIVRFALGHLQHDDGGSVYLRLSTRPLSQPERSLGAELKRGIVEGGYWLAPPAPGADLALVYTGVVAPEVQEAFAELREDAPGAGLLAVTSADRLHAGWRSAQTVRAAGDLAARAPVENLLAPLAREATLVTVLDGHPAALSWMGAVLGHRVVSLGVEGFGQSGDIPDLYREYRLSTDAILGAVARACLDRPA
jgi:pyruvate dehydrogenase E1 component